MAHSAFGATRTEQARRWPTLRSRKHSLETLLEVTTAHDIGALCCNCWGRTAALSSRLRDWAPAARLATSRALSSLLGHARTWNRTSRSLSVSTSAAHLPT